MNPKIIFQDSQMMLVDKPAGLIVNRVEGATIKTLQDWLEVNTDLKRRRPKESESRETKEFYLRSGLVHRLDKETSGIILVAKTPETYAFLKNQFKRRKVRKRYLGLVHGLVKPEKGRIEFPIARHRQDPHKFMVFLGGRSAVTDYSVLAHKTKRGWRFIDESSILEYFGKDLFLNDQKAGFSKKNEYSLVEFKPVTGRTHQIRVHLRYLRYPLFGDLKYGYRRQVVRDRVELNRHFLHSYSLSFIRPKTKERVRFCAVVPRQLYELVGKL